MVPTLPICFILVSGMAFESIVIPMNVDLLIDASLHSIFQLVSQTSLAFMRNFITFLVGLKVLR